MTLIYKMALAFIKGMRTGISSHCEKDKSLRDNLSEHQIDNMVSDSFPASDPPSTY